MFFSGPLADLLASPVKRRRPEQRLATAGHPIHFDRHGVIRGIQRGTGGAERFVPLSQTSVDVGSSYATTKTKASQSQRAVDDEAPIAISTA